MTNITTFAPEEIEDRSFAIIDSEVPEPRPFEGVRWEVVRRMIHTTADFELLSLVTIHKEAVSAGIAAIRYGCTIVTDTEMVRAGIGKGRVAPWGCTVACHIGDAEVARRAREQGITRARAAVDLVARGMDGGIFVFGNAPTALLRLLDYIDEGTCCPALVVGMPVGFVNAEESKELLMKQEKTSYITIRGRKGGSAVAASVVNALAELAGTAG